MLVVPERFNKNAQPVRDLAPSAESGAWLIEYMCKRIGIPDLSQSDVLDFGCGSRFAETFVNLGIPVRSYLGIDVDREMIEYLNQNVDDARLSFVWWDSYNSLYNPNGCSLDQYDTLPVDEKKFDIICMFSVITHQIPKDTIIILRSLRRHIRPAGNLFFSATIEDLDEDYREIVAASPTAHSAYSLRLLRQLTEEAGWRIISVEPKLPPGGPLGRVPIQDSVLCVPI